jgi:hypothetical protein
MIKLFRTFFLRLEKGNMQLSEWSKSELEYGRRVLNSGLDGVHSGQEAFLNGSPLSPFFRKSCWKALKPAALGACIGLLTSCPRDRSHRNSRLLVSGLLGGLIGFGAGVLWESRFLAKSAADGALKNIGKIRDEHWFEKHPIDYA